MILKTYVRVFTADMALTLPLYKQLVGREPDIHFQVDAWEMVAIGDFLLTTGKPEDLALIRDLLGPLIVQDLAATRHLLEAAGATITRETETTPTGAAFYAQHADGTRMEYVQWKAELVERIIVGNANGSRAGLG